MDCTLSVTFRWDYDTLCLHQVHRQVPEEYARTESDKERMLRKGSQAMRTNLYAADGKRRSPSESGGSSDSDDGRVPDEDPAVSWFGLHSKERLRGPNVFRHWARG